MGQGPAKPTRQEEKLGKFCCHKTQKLGKNPIGVISKFRGQNLGHLAYIFWRQNWASNKNFRGRFWGQAPLSPNAEAPPGPSSPQVQPCNPLADPKLHNLVSSSSAEYTAYILLSSTYRQPLLLTLAIVSSIIFRFHK